MAPRERSVRPDRWRTEVLSGRIAYDQAPASIQSWLRHDIFLGAEAICRIENKAERTAALGKIPPLIRPYVEAEVKRLWPTRDR